MQITEAYRKTWATRATCDALLQEIDAEDPFERPDAETHAAFAAIKLAAEKFLLEAADVSVQVFGGLGLLKSTGLEYVFRVARNLRIPGGRRRYSGANRPFARPAEKEIATSPRRSL